MKAPRFSGATAAAFFMLLSLNALLFRFVFPGGVESKFADTRPTPLVALHLAAFLATAVLLTSLCVVLRAEGSSLKAAGIGGLAGLLAALPSTLHTSAMAAVSASGEVRAVLWTTVTWALAAAVAHGAFWWRSTRAATGGPVRDTSRERSRSDHAAGAGGPGPMRSLAMIAAVLAAARLSAADPPDPALADAAAAILRNDYRADRAQLLRLAQDLERGPVGPHEKYRRYWIAFAYWRRLLNGLNETPKPADLAEDFERCAAQAKAALALDPGFEDARGALMGCAIGRFWVPGGLPEERKADFFREMTDVMSALTQNAGSNPRSLWLVGMQQAYRPPGGDPSVAIATWKRGLAAAREEALSAGARAPWVPSWGAPEILMNLANFHTYSRPDKAVARAYAEGALAMAPEWHYLRNILLPAIEKLPDAPPAPSADRPTPAPSGPSEQP